MAKSRARAIDSDVIEVVSELLREWNGKLTWDLLVKRIRDSIGIEYTRQALDKHEQIAREFSLRKSSLRKESGRPAPSNTQIDALQKKIDRLTAENELLTIECNNYRAMFVVWTANAVKKGLTEKMLNEPLLAANRPSSDDQPPAFRKNAKGKKPSNG